MREDSSSGKRYERISGTLEKKWFIISQERIALTGDGMMFWNSVAGEIFDSGA